MESVIVVMRVAGVGTLIATFGAPLSTATGVLGPAEGAPLPAVSAPVFDTIEMDAVPLPEQLERVTRSTEAVCGVTESTVQLTPPLPLTVTSPGDKVKVAAPAYVTSKSTV